MIVLVGWFGAALVLVSYAQRNTIRLRQISLLASAALIIFNLILGVWPNVALEVALVVVNVRRLIRRHRPSIQSAITSVSNVHTVTAEATTPQTPRVRERPTSHRQPTRRRLFDQPRRGRPLQPLSREPSGEDTGDSPPGGTAPTLSCRGERRSVDAHGAPSARAS